MGRKQVTRNNHYVPQFYLKCWSGNGNTVLTYRLLVPNLGEKVWKQMPIRHLASWFDLYTQHNDANDADAIEKELGNWEMKAAGAFRKVREGTELSDDDMHFLVDFLFLQLFRTPSALEYMNEKLKEIYGPTLAECVREAEQKLRESTSMPEDLKLESTRIGFQRPYPSIPIQMELDEENCCINSCLALGRQSALSVLGYLLTDSPVREFMHSCHWQIFTIPAERGLPTSDKPVVVVHSSQQGRHSSGMRLDEPGTIIFLPLTPHHLLLTRVGCNEKEIEELCFDEKTEAFVHNAIINNASPYGYIFSQEIICGIESIRPRKVDRDLCSSIRSERASWDEVQSRAERGDRRWEQNGLRVRRRSWE